MKYLRKFNESIEPEDDNLYLIEDFLLEYLDKWKLIEDNKYSNLKFADKKYYNGTYKIEHTSTTFFKLTGFPNGKEGYRIKICFTKEFDENEFKVDMAKFINRVRCTFFEKSGYDFDTYKQNYGERVVTYYIAFFR